MSFFKKLFGENEPVKNKPAASKITTPAVLPPVKNQSSDPSKDPNMIQVFDGYGREMFITKEEWRKKVLPGAIRDQWNNPENLYGVIFGALNDGFTADIVQAAQQLYKIDTQPTRGTCVWGISLMKEGRLDEAEKVFKGFIAKHGEDGVILTNLAKVYSAQKKDVKAQETLWHALELDPNQDNGMGWYYAIHQEPGGEEAGREALRRVGALPGSWRAQLWLARFALQAGRLEEAVGIYQGCLARMTKPVPVDFLRQMSGDLGQTGHLPELLNLTEPHFDIHLHGLQVGNNLIKSHLDLGQLDAARQILDQLFALNRMDWKKTLSFWDAEIAKARLATSGPLDQNALKLAMLPIEGPVWLKPSSPATELFPAKSAEPPTIAFLGSSAEINSNSKPYEPQMSDGPGRASRALPLFLAEQVEFQSEARVQVLFPWIMNESCGFVLSGVAWKDDEAANYARQGEIKSDYVVTTFLKATAEPWVAELRLIRTIDARCLGTLNTSFAPAKPQEAIPELARQLLTLLAREAEVKLQSAPPLYQVPAGEQFPVYLLRLEQLLAVRCGGIDGVNAGFLSGERDIIDGNLQLCVACPGNVSARIMLAQTLLSMKRVRPGILPEFKEKIALLQKEKPLPEPANAVVQRLLNEGFMEPQA